MCLMSPSELELVSGRDVYGGKVQGEERERTEDF